MIITIIISPSSSHECWSRQRIERIENYHNKPLHGYYPQVHKDLLGPKFNFLWLSKGFLIGEKEGLLIAAQNQALLTRTMQHIYSAATSPLCYLCGNYDETFEHLVSGCGFLAVSQYIIRHNHVARHIHWDFNIYTDRANLCSSSRHSYYQQVGQFSTTHRCFYPTDRHIVSKENEKIDKYQELRIELVSRRPQLKQL